MLEGIRGGGYCTPEAQLGPLYLIIPDGFYMQSGQPLGGGLTNQASFWQFGPNKNEICQCYSNIYLDSVCIQMSNSSRVM